MDENIQQAADRLRRVENGDDPFDVYGIEDRPEAANWRWGDLRGRELAIRLICVDRAALADAYLREHHTSESVDTMNCVLCDKQMYPAMKNTFQFHPGGGGEIRFVFGPGCKKFLHNSVRTEYRGIVCFDCAEKHLSKMTKS